MDRHVVKDCPKALIKCRNGCKEQIEWGNMQNHIQYDCPYEVIECPNKGSRHVF